MAMSRKFNKSDHMMFHTIEQLVPQNHDVRKLESCIDWDLSTH